MLNELVDSVRSQITDVDIELLVVDGGSDDGTPDQARALGCKVLDNARKRALFGKNLAYNECSSRYLMFLDHDERLASKTAIQDALSAMREGSAPIVMAGGYVVEAGESSVTHYRSAVGDPLMAFVFPAIRLAPLWEIRIREFSGLIKRGLRWETFCFFGDLPLVESASMGVMIDRKWFAERFPDLEFQPELIPHLFYRVHQQGVPVGFVASSRIQHRSGDTWSRYLSKLRRRIRTQVYFGQSGGRTGMIARHSDGSGRLRLRAVLFPIYALSVIGPAISAVGWSTRTKSLAPLHHIWLAPYTAGVIVTHVARWLMGLGPRDESPDRSGSVG